MPRARRRRRQHTSEIQPSAEGRWRLSPRVIEGGFEAWPALDELFPVTVQGVNHNRGIEGSIIDTDENALANRLSDYIKKPTFASASAAYPQLAPPKKADGKPAIVGYDPETVWTALGKLGFEKARLKSFLTFPLDQRTPLLRDAHQAAEPSATRVRVEPGG